MISTTSTGNLQVEVLPEVSVAVQVTVVVPMGKRLPEAGAQVTTGEGSQASVAVTVKLTVAPARVEARAVSEAGHMRVGGVASLTVTVKVFVSVPGGEPSSVTTVVRV
jgi:hypothetical protein